MVKAIHAIPSGKWWTCKIATECNIGARIRRGAMDGIQDPAATEQAELPPKAMRSEEKSERR